MNNEIKLVASRVAARIANKKAAVTRMVELVMLVARADGVIDDTEREAIAVFAEELLGPLGSREAIDHVVNELAAGLDAESLAAHCEAIGKALANADVVTEGIELAIHVALASDGLADSEKDVIYAIAKSAGATPEQTALLIARLSRASVRPPVALDVRHLALERPGSLAL